MLEDVNDKLPDNAESGDDLYERFNFKIDKGQDPLRIDKFLMARIERATRNKLQQAINTRTAHCSSIILMKFYL